MEIVKKRKRIIRVVLIYLRSSVSCIISVLFFSPAAEEPRNLPSCGQQAGK